MPKSVWGPNVPVKKLQTTIGGEKTLECQLTVESLAQPTWAWKNAE